MQSDIQRTIRRRKKELIDEAKESTKILTVPTLLNISRIILMFVVGYLIVTDRSIIMIVIVFCVAAITDWFDGYFARKWKLANDFGRKADMFADRVLWVGTALFMIVSYGGDGLLRPIHGVQLLLIMIREIIATPFAIAGAFSGALFPHARYSAKVTTFLQGFAIPALLLSLMYPAWTYFSFPLSVVIGFFGAVSGLNYIRDVQAMKEGTYRPPKKKSKK
jgi:phosphatidylglycerophosphate synthase